MLRLDLRLHLRLHLHLRYHLHPSCVGVTAFLCNVALLGWLVFQEFLAAAIAVTVFSFLSIYFWKRHVEMKWYEALKLGRGGATAGGSATAPRAGGHGGSMHHAQREAEGLQEDDGDGDLEAGGA